ncbi:MAG: geranylgeranylglycerol-phosphate geranylgeranyltransferase [archaeon]
MKAKPKLDIKALFELMRPTNCLMAGLAAALGYALAGGIVLVPAVLAFFAVFFICGAGEAINDAFDAHIDEKNKKKKPITLGKVTSHQALYFSLILFCLGVAMASMIGFNPFVIAVIFSTLLVLYSSVLRKAKYIGNIVVAGGTAFTLIFGAISAGNVSLLIQAFAVSAFLANMSRELAKDFEDMKTDKGFKKSMPMLSRKVTKIAIIAYYILAASIGVLCYFAFNLSWFYLAMMLAALAVFAYSSKKLLDGNFKKSQSFSKKGMLLSILAFASALIK